jgi:hypothetical protein
MKKAVKKLLERATPVSQPFGSTRVRCTTPGVSSTEGPGFTLPISVGSAAGSSVTGEKWPTYLRALLRGPLRVRLKEAAPAQAVSCWLPTVAARVCHVGFVVDKVALGQDKMKPRTALWTPFKLETPLCEHGLSTCPMTLQSEG